MSLRNGTKVYGLLGRAADGHRTTDRLHTSRYVSLSVSAIVLPFISPYLFTGTRAGYSAPFDPVRLILVIDVRMLSDTVEFPNDKLFKEQE